MKQVKDKLPEKDTEQQIISHQPMINPLSCLWWEGMTASDTKSTAHPSQPHFKQELWGRNIARLSD